MEALLDGHDVLDGHVRRSVDVHPLEGLVRLEHQSGWTRAKNR